MATVPLIKGDSGSIGAGATQNFRLGHGTFSSSSTEANRQTLFRAAGVLTRIYITILTNDRGASTFRVRKNGADGNLVCSITASTTGEFEDITNSDTVAAGDLFNFRLATGAGGTTFTFNVARVLFTPTSDTVTVTSNQSSNIGATNIFNALVGISGSAGTEANNQTKIPIACTWQSLGVFVSANTRDAAVTYTTRVNSAAGAQSVSIGSTLTGWFEDLVNTDTLALDDLICYNGVTAGTTGTVTVQTIKSEYLSTVNKMFFAGGGSPGGTAAGATEYSPLCGTALITTTESDAVLDIGVNLIASRIGIQVTANTIIGNSTFKLRKNGADGNQSASIPGLTTGHFSDTTNTDSVIASDSLVYQLNGGAGGTSMSTRQFYMGATAVVSGGSTLLMMGVG